MSISKQDLYKRILDLGMEKKYLKRDIKELEERLKKLECPHENLSFEEIACNSEIYGYCKCNDCNNIIKRYKNKKEFNRRKAEYHNKKWVEAQDKEE